MTKSKVVVVTGATGFIGARIVERLVGATHHQVRALSTGHGRMSRLAIHPPNRMSWSVCDVNDQQAVANSIEDGDVVVHCAFGSSGDVDARWLTTVAGTRNVMRAAADAGVQRVVHLSTVDVYSRALSGMFDETAARLKRDDSDREYEQQKLAAQEIVTSAFARHVILQPGIVYGPFGKQWTTVQLERLAAGVRGLPSATDPAGSCNAIYVDDVADAVIRAIESDGIDGSQFLLNGPDEVSWGDFFDGMRRVGRAVPVDSIPDESLFAEEWELELYRRSARADCSAAERVLGWHPSTTLREGVARTAEWWAWTNKPMT